MRGNNCVLQKMPQGSTLLTLSAVCMVCTQVYVFGKNHCVTCFLSLWFTDFSDYTLSLNLRG